jgi:hypothetical protein
MRSFRMDGEGVDGSMMGLIMLDDLFGSEVKHTDSLIVGACEHALVSRMEASTGD